MFSLARLRSLFGSAVAQGSKQIAQFEFEQRQTTLFKETARPVARVRLWSSTYENWQQVEMVIDTGADYTLLPRYVASLVGIDLDKQAQKVKTVGLGGEQEVYLIRDMKVKIGTATRVIPVGFLSHNGVPPLMGRQAFFETFRTEFAFNRQVTFFE